MRNSLLILILLIAITPSHSAFADKPDWCGVWDAWGNGKYDTTTFPFLKGSMVHIRWEQIEPSNNSFNWSLLNSQLNTAAGKGLYIMIKVYIGGKGRRAPAWLFENGVPKVEGTTFPYYPDEDFKTYYKRLITKVSTHIETLSQDIRGKIISVQIPAGQSGDERPWPGTMLASDHQYYLPVTGTTWQNYNQEIFQHAYHAYSSHDPKIVVVVNPHRNNYEWLQTNCPGIGYKGTKLGTGYQCNQESDYADWRPHYYTQFHGYWTARSRAEFTSAPWDTGNFANTGQWFGKAPVWNMYWQVLWMLYQGDSHGAWVALKDGLDAENTTRWPEETYGLKANGTNLTRYQKIVAGFAGRGAIIGDESALNVQSSALGYSMAAKALNDVNYRIDEKNYSMFMEQIDPLTTSVGYWRVGSTSERYGRFARGFDHSSGKNTMTFDIDDDFFGGSPLNGAYTVTVKVIYYDSGTGTWQLQYDAVSNNTKTAYTVTKTNTKTWIAKEVTIIDGNFGNQGTNGSDLSLINNDTENDIFHMVEVTRASNDRECFWGYGVYPEPACQNGAN